MSPHAMDMHLTPLMPPSLKFILSLACRTSFSPGFLPLLLPLLLLPLTFELNQRVLESPTDSDLCPVLFHFTPVTPTTPCILMNPHSRYPTWHLYLCPTEEPRHNINQYLPWMPVYTAPPQHPKPNPVFLQCSISVNGSASIP